jgi:predicted dehydrogenase
MAETKEDGKGGLSRRDFIAAAAGAAVVAGTAKQADASVYKSILPSAVLGANETIRTGHIGLFPGCGGPSGTADLKFAVMNGNFQPIMLCDPNLPHVEKRVKPMFREKTADAVVVDDFRKVIENKDVDAVVIATPDHWHCLPTLCAAEAGKAIYCEKPLCTTLAEAHAMHKAVKDSGVVFQGGTVQRSGQHFRKAVEMVRSGQIGKVARIETFSLDNTSLNGIGMGDTDEAKYKDKGLNWDMQQGWVEHKPFNVNRWAHNFRWYLDYSGGKITGWGADLMDIAMMAVGDDFQPKSVSAVGGKYIMQDSRTTPDTLDVFYRFDGFILSFTNRVWNPLDLDGDQPDHGIVFYGERGILRVSRMGLDVYASPQNQTADKKTVTERIEPETPDQEAALNLPHWQNFADSIRGIAKPNSPIDSLFNTTRVCLIGSCAYVAGAHFASGAKFDGTSMPDEAPTHGQATLDWDAETQKFAGGDAETARIANNWAYREYQNGWSLKAPHHA